MHVLRRTTWAAVLGCISVLQAVPVPAAPGNVDAACPASQILGTPTLFEIGDGPTFSASGDFNADGRLDIAYANFCDHQVALLLGNGRGDLAAPRTIDVGFLPATVAAGDLNGDGALDLAVANSGDHDVSILLGDGNGNLVARPRTYPVGNSPRGLTTADFNRDGRLDLAVANLGFSPFPLGCQNKTDHTRPPVVSDLSEHRVAILLGDGAGGFIGETGHEARFVDAGPNPGRIEGGDLDEDGDLDLAVTNNSTATVSVLTNDGAGTFVRTQSLPVGANPSFVEVADLSGDGLLDLATTDNGSDTISVILGRTGIAFEGRRTFAVPSPRDMDAADLNADGLVDLAVTHGSSVALLLGKGGGNFGDAESRDHFADIHTGGNGGAEPVEAADFDRDGHPDLALGLALESLEGDDHVSLLLNTCIQLATVEFSGDCDELVFAGEVSADRIDEFVPEHFDMKRAGGENGPTAVFVMSAVSCWNVKLGDTRIPPFIEEFAGVDIEVPQACRRARDETKDACGGGHSYQFWSVHTSKPLANALARQGHPCPQAPCIADVEFAGGLGDAVSAARVSVSWSFSGRHSIDVTTTAPTVSLTGDKTFDDNGGAWHAGARGLVRRVFMLNPLDLQAGVATLTVEADSLLARMVGATTVTGAGLIAHHHFQGKSQLVGT